MPTSVLWYLIAYIGFTAWSVVDDIRSRAEPLWFSAAEIVGDVCLVIVALSFWLFPIRQALSGSSLVVFALGLALLLGQAGRSFYRKIISDPELSFGGKLFVGVAGSSLVIVMSAPLIFWGFKAAVLRVSNDT